MRVPRLVAWVAIATLLLATLATSVFQLSPSSAAPSSPLRNTGTTTIASDPFGMAHISAINSQQPTYATLRYQQATDAGAAWNRWVFYWHEIEQSAGNPNYAPQDATVNQDVANGFRYKIDAVLMGSPSWATTASAATAGLVAPPPRVGEHSYGKVSTLAADSYNAASPVVAPPQNLDLAVFADGTDIPGPGKQINQSNYWARFVYGTVNRFKDRVRHWEIWNEPDYYPSAASGWYGFWSGTPDQYFRLLKVAYLAAKGADPSAVIVMGGMAYWPEIVQQGKQPFNFFKRVLTLATSDSLGSTNGYFFDATAWHWYNRSNQSYYKVVETKSVLNSYGLGAKAIWNNETGMPAWNDSLKPPPGGNSPYFGSGTVTEQASYVLQSLAYALAAGVERSIAFQEYDDGNGEAFGFVRNNAVPRPSYYAYRLATTYLTGATSATLAERGSVSVVTASTAAGNRIVALWNNSPSPTQISVQATAGSALLLGQPTESNLAGTQQTIYPSAGQYLIWLPGATNNNGTSSADYIVGGLVSLLVEAGQVGPTPTPTATPSPTATPGPTPTPGPFSGGLIANGGFERQPAFTGWRLAGHLTPVIRSPGYHGSYQALLGANYQEEPGLLGANSTLTQTVHLPAAATQLQLEFAYFLNSSQPVPANLGDLYSYDKFEVLLFEANGTRHDLLFDYTGKFWWADATIDLSPYRGQSVTIVFNVWQSQASANYQTTVYLDSVRIWPFVATVPITQRNGG